MTESPHVALVTGASSGIGAATALELASRGASIAIHYHQNAAGAQAIQRQIQERGGNAILLQAALQSKAAAQQMVEQALAQFGRIDVLVNNAGSMIGRRMLLEISEDFWRESLDTNISSVLWVTQAAVSGMIEKGGGTVVNVASVAARNGGSPGVLAYAASKSAVLCMTKSMAKELIRSGVRVNGVNPGIIDTPFHERFTGDERFRALVNGIPQGRPGTSEEVAKVIAFLAGPDASHLVGEVIEVNGGLWMD